MNRDDASDKYASRRILETLTLPRPRCPQCNGTKLTKYRSVSDQGDGTSLAYVRCACGHRFRVLLE